MRSMVRKAGKWALRLVSALLVLFALYIAPLIYPDPLFAHAARYDQFVVYSDGPLPADLDRVIENATHRLEGMEHPPPGAIQRVYLCNSRRRYDFFAFLTRKNPESLAIGLSFLNRMFVSMTRVRLFADRNQGVLRHTRFEGNLAEVICHEIAHANSIHSVGLRAHLAQPMWKSEGWAEYQANLAAIRDDPTYDLRLRIERLLDDDYWGGGEGVARHLWESQILVEYLCEVEGYKLTDLIEDDVTLSSTRRRMMEWYERGDS